MSCIFSIPRYCGQERIYDDIFGNPAGSPKLKSVHLVLWVCGKLTDQRPDHRFSSRFPCSTISTSASPIHPSPFSYGRDSANIALTFWPKWAGVGEDGKRIFKDNGKKVYTRICEIAVGDRSIGRCTIITTTSTRLLLPFVEYLSWKLFYVYQNNII